LKIDVIGNEKVMTGGFCFSQRRKVRKETQRRRKRKSDIFAAGILPELCVLCAFARTFLFPTNAKLKILCWVLCISFLTCF